MTRQLSKLIFLVALFLGVATPESLAETNSPAGSCAATSRCREPSGTGLVWLGAPDLLAVWSIGKWFAGSGGRTRVVQFCVVTMCIALFIMMRKLN